MDNNILIIGIGNEYRSDDRIGLFIADKIHEKNQPGVTVEKASGEGTALMDLWKEKSCVIIIDAVSSNSSPGKVHRFNAHEESIPSKTFQCSTHNLSLVEAIELSRSLNSLPKKLIIFGIEGKDFSHGENISSEIKKLLDNIIKKIENEIESLQKEKTNA